MPRDSKTLFPDTIHIWTIRLNVSAQQLCYYENLLSSDEIDRANRFASTALKNQFIVCRGKLREILATYAAGITPDKLIFDSHRFGKPYLRDNHGIHFNYAHSADFAMLAIAHNMEVGIDLEQLADVDMHAIAARFFSESEIAALQAAPDEKRKQIFFRIWVRKESYMKALGKGFNLPCRDFSVLNDSLVHPTLIFQAQTAWKITDIKSPEGCHAALCGAGKYWQYTYMNGYSAGDHS